MSVVGGRCGGVWSVVVGPCLLFLAAARICAAALPRPPFGSAWRTFTGPFDSSDPRADVYYPTGLPKGRAVPLLSFSHGLLGGGDVFSSAYIPLLLQWAKYGFVIVAPRACSKGCADTCVTLPGGDPKCFGTYYEQQLRAMMDIPAEYKVLFMQGGAHGQFSAVPLNLCGDGRARTRGPFADSVLAPWPRPLKSSKGDANTLSHSAMALTQAWRAFTPKHLREISSKTSGARIRKITKLNSSRWF